MHRTSFPVNTFYVPRILRLHAEIGGMFADNMDLLTLMRWRLTCKTNYEQATSSLRRSLMTMLNVFVPSAIVILDLITQYRSVIGGEFALAYVLRDPSIMSDSLDIFTTDYEFDSLCSSIMGNPAILNAMVRHEYTQNTVLDALRTLVSRILTIHTTRGKIIRIHRSYTSSATAPISRASSTALSNFVTAFGFACSHPVLTLDRRALITDQELAYLPTMNNASHDYLISHNFSLATSPTAWPEFRSYVPPPPRRYRPEPPSTADQVIISQDGGADQHTQSTATSPDRVPGNPAPAHSTVARGIQTGSLVTLGVVPDEEGADESQWLAPVVGDAPAEDIVYGPAPSELLSFGESIIDFGSRTHAEASPDVNNQTGCAPSQTPRVNASLGCDTQDADAGPVSGSASSQDVIGMHEHSILDTLYTHEADALLDVGTPSPPSPMTALLTAFDPNDRIGFDLPFCGNGSPLPFPASPQHYPATTEQSSCSPFLEGTVGYDATGFIDFPGSATLSSFGSPLIKDDLYPFAEVTGLSAAPSTICPEPMYPVPAEWSVEFARYVQTDNVDPPLVVQDPLQSLTNDRSMDPWAGVTVEGNTSFEHYTSLHRDSDTGVHAGWSLSEGCFAYREVGSVERPLPPSSDPSAGQDAVHLNRRTGATTPTLVSAGTEENAEEGGDLDDPIAATGPTYLPDRRTVGTLNPQSSVLRGIELGAAVGSIPANSLGVGQTPSSGQDVVGPGDSAATRRAECAERDEGDALRRVPDTGDETLESDVGAEGTPERTIAVELAAFGSTGDHSSIDSKVPSPSHTDNEPPAPASHPQDAPAGNVRFAFSPEAVVEVNVYDTTDDAYYDDDGDTEVDLPAAVECWRHRFVCPSQGRFFGDSGSFVEFFDPLRGGEQYCAEKSLPPFGPMVVWRVLSVFNCEEGCDMYDDVLEEGVTSIPVLIRRDPWGKLRDVISDRKMAGLARHRSLSP